MKLVVTFMPPFPSAGQLIHLTKEYDDVESWEVTERNVLAIVLSGGQSVHYNWAHVRGLDVDEFGSVRPTNPLVRP